MVFVEVLGFHGKGWAVAELVLDIELCERAFSCGRLGDGGHTGIPAVVMIDMCVEEKMRWPLSLAALNRRATSADRFSESPNCMADGMGRNWRSEDDRG